MAKHSEPRVSPDTKTLWVRLLVFAGVVAVAIVTENAYIVGAVTFLGLVVLGWNGPWPWRVYDKESSRD